MRQTLKSLRKIITVQTLIVATLAVVSTHVCRVTDLTAEFPLALIGIAVVFPLVFSISGAYKRREASLDDYGSMKEHRRAIFFASRDWLGEPPEYSGASRGPLRFGRRGRRDHQRGEVDRSSEPVRTLFTAHLINKDTHRAAAGSRIALLVDAARRG